MKLKNNTSLRLHSFFSYLSVGYLELPLIIFILGWTKIYIALPAIIIIGWLSWRLRLVLPSQSSQLFSFTLHRKTIALCLLILFGWAFISGAGHYGVQTTDYNKHNAILNDLTERSWPVTYQFENHSSPLVYYIGYYLPTATVAKLFHNPELTRFFSLMWLYVGVVIAFYWAARLTGKPSVLLCILFVLFSGMDILGQVILHTADSTIPLISRGSLLEWYTGIANIQYSSNSTLLFWVPQHALAGWIAGGLLVSLYIEKRSPRLIGFLWCLTLLWSPLVSIGLLPFALMHLLYTKRNRFNEIMWRQIFSPENCLVLVTIIPLLLLFLISGSADHSAGTYLAFSGPMSATLKTVFLIVFILLEFGILALLLRKYVTTKENREWNIIFWTICISLSILPLFRYGFFNDLAMRGSIPLLFIFMILAGRFLHYYFINPPQPYKRQDVILIIGIVSTLVIGSITALVEINEHTISLERPRRDWQSIGNRNVDPMELFFMQQYLGTKDSLFFKVIAQDK